MVKPQRAGKRERDGARSKLQASVGVLPGVQHQGAGRHGGHQRSGKLGTNLVPSNTAVTQPLTYPFVVLCVSISTFITHTCSLVFNTGEYPHQCLWFTVGTVSLSLSHSLWFNHGQHHHPPQSLAGDHNVALHPGVQHWAVPPPMPVAHCLWDLSLLQVCVTG